jgi:hypothetical protein
MVWCSCHDNYIGVDIWLWAIKWYGDYKHKRKQGNYGAFGMTKHSNMATPKKIEPRSSGHYDVCCWFKTCSKPINTTFATTFQNACEYLNICF